MILQCLGSTALTFEFIFLWYGEKTDRTTICANCRRKKVFNYGRSRERTLNLKIFHENHIISKWSGGYLQIHIIEKEQMNYQINLAHGLLMNLVDRKFGFYFSVFLFKRKSTTIDKKCTCILCFENRLSICYGYIHRKFFSESTNWNGPQALKC